MIEKLSVLLQLKITLSQKLSTGQPESCDDAVRTVSDWNQLPAAVVEQENPAAFNAQLARCAPTRMP